MSRIETRFGTLRAMKRAGLVTFVMGCDPDFDTSLALLRGLPTAGADVIEIGVPFSDPMADGPAIQLAGQRALKSGASLHRILELVQAFRREDRSTPIVLMGYYNPIYRYGAEAFCADAAEAGVDGLIVVDLPPEEDGELGPHAQESGLDLIRLATPTTHAARMPAVTANARGFIYYVAVRGVTGTRSAAADDVARGLARVRKYSALPVAVGFGIRTPDQAAEIARIADAAVVGSALVDTLAKNLDAAGRPTHGAVENTLAVVRSLGRAVRGARAHAKEAR